MDWGVCPSPPRSANDYNFSISISCRKASFHQHKCGTSHLTLTLKQNWFYKQGCNVQSSQRLSVADPGFPTGREHQPKGRFANQLICIIFAENCMKIKKMDWGVCPSPPRSANDYNFFKSYFYSRYWVFARVDYEFTLLSSVGSKGVPGTHAPWGFKFFHFHAVFGKKKG